MRKSPSTGPKPKPSNRSAATPSVADRPSKSAAPESVTNRRWLEVAAPATAVLEPAAAPGVAPFRRVRFGYFNPDAREVQLVGVFNGWDPMANPMRRDALGDWSTVIELQPGEHRYRFLVDGEWRDDPSAQQTALNPFGGFDAVMVVV
jgi:hypothetical protein